MQCSIDIATEMLSRCGYISKTKSLGNDMDYIRRSKAQSIYRIAGNFRGTKYSWFSNIETFRG